MINQAFNRIIHSSLIKSFSIYTIAQVINAAIPFLILPVMTTYLTPSDYGIISMITTVNAFLVPFVTMKLDTAVVRRYYYKDDDIAKYIGNCIIIVLSLFASVNVAFLLTTKFLVRLTSIPYYVLWIIPLFSLCSFFKSIVLYYWQVNNKPLYFGLLSIISTALELSISLTLIINLGLNWKGRAIGLFLTAFLVALFAIFYLTSKGMIKIKIEREMIKHAIRFGSGLVPAAIGSTMITMSDRFFINTLISVGETGLYSVACSFASIMSFVTVSFCNAFIPWMFENLSKKTDEANRRIVKISYLYMIGIFFIGVVLFFIIRVVFPFFVNSSFNDSFKFIPWLLLGNVFYGCYLLMINYILYSEKTIYSTLITFSCGIIGALLNYAFIILMGAIGAALATALTFAIFFVMTWIIANHVYPMPWIRKKEL